MVGPLDQYSTADDFDGTGRSFHEDDLPTQQLIYEQVPAAPDSNSIEAITCGIPLPRANGA